MIEALSDEMSKGFGSQRIDRVHISGETGIDTALTSMLNRRMVEMKKIPAQRNTQKKAQMGNDPDNQEHPVRFLEILIR